MKKPMMLLSVLAPVLLPCLVFGIEAATPTASVGVMEWVMMNKIAVLTLLLAISEFLALIPGIQGNGILDSIIKLLKAVATPPKR